jgi:uncharacterized iron-regulated membrane protein
VLVFDETVAGWLQPGLYHTAEPASTPNVQAAMERVRAAYPEQDIKFVRLPRGPREHYRVWLADDETTRVFVNPADAEIRGANALYGGPIGLLRDFHIHLFAGQTGLKIVGVFGIGLLLMASSGVWLWWPARHRWRAAFRIHGRAARARLVYDLHRVIGASAALLLALSALTGVFLSYYDTAGLLMRAALGGEPIPDPPPLEKPVPDEAERSADALLARAKALFPSARPTWVIPSPDGDHPLLVRFRQPGNTHPEGHSFIGLHPSSAALLYRHDWRAGALGQKGLQLSYPLHIGTIGGWLYKSLLFVLGLVPVLLLITGTMMWWRRVRPVARLRGRRARKQNQPRRARSARPLHRVA